MNSTHPSSKKSSTSLLLVTIMLLVVFFIAAYTYVLQENTSRNTLDAAVARNKACSDQIYESVSDDFTKKDYTDINTTSDMKKPQYQKLQSRLNEFRKLNGVRYLYTAKKAADGTLIYLIDGLDLDADDFAYPGTAIEHEILPYLNAALKGETIYSQEIMDTTWGHIFTACYPIYDSGDSDEIIGVLCLEMDMETTYASIKAINRSAMFLAVAAILIALLLIICTAAYTHTQRKKDQQQQLTLQKAAEAAQAANKAKSTFLFNMSHDIRTPINAILGYTDLAQNHLDEPQTLRSYLKNIHVSGEKLLSIINNVLELARIENNSAVIEMSAIETGEVFDSCLVMSRNAMEKKHQTLLVHKDIRYPYVYVDNAHTSEILLNIISNAVKYTGEGGTISCSFEQYPHEKDGWCYAKVSVKDNGIGISDEFREHLFEAFSRERSSTISGIDGTGLGMGIVKKLLDMMDGTIDVQSKLGEGSTFTVTIPCRIASKEDIEAKNAIYHLDRVNVAGLKILLAEDNDLNAEIATELLATEGLYVERAENGVACIEMMEKHPAGYYDLILMDVQMPIMDGYKASKVIRHMEDPQKASIPIVAVTANAFAEDREKALEAGMNDHVAKPIDMNALMLVFRKLLHVKLITSEEASVTELNQAPSCE